MTLFICGFLIGYGVRGLLQIAWARSANAPRELAEYRRSLNDY